MKEKRIRQLKKQMPLSDLAGSSAYFREMAAEGKLLDEVGYLYYYFREEEPQDIRYEATVFTEYPSAEQLEEYAEKGWRVVSHWEQEFVFATEDMEIPSLFGIDGWELEKVERSLEALEKNKTSKGEILASAILFLVLICALAKNGMYALLREEIIWFLLPFVAAAVVYVVQKLHLQRKRVRLLEDADECTETDWRKNRTHHRSWLAAGALLVLAVIWWYSGIGGKVTDLPGEISYTDLPAVRLERLAGEDFISWGERIDPTYEGFRITPQVGNTDRYDYQDQKRNGEIENYVTRYRSRLLGGKAAATTQAMQDGETGERQWLETTYYTYPAEALAKRGYAKRASRLEDGGGIFSGKALLWSDAKKTKLSVLQGDWDALAVFHLVNEAENAEKRVLLVRQGTQMMELHYRGDAALEEVLAEVKAVFAAQK